MKRNHGNSRQHPNQGGGKKAKYSKQESESDGESESEGLVEPKVRIPAVIEKAGTMDGHRQSGVVTYFLPTGAKRYCLYFEEQSVANGYTLKSMRNYTSNPNLTFPFKVGMPVSIIEIVNTKAHRCSHKVTIELGGDGVPGAPLTLENLSGKDIPNLDGKEVIGLIRAFEKSTGVASFSTGEGVSGLALFSMQEMVIGGLEVPKSMFQHVAFVGMSVNLKITSSDSTKIPGIYYMANVNVDIPVSSGDGIKREKPEEFRGVITKVSDQGPTMISCFFEENVAEKFFVVCEYATANKRPTSESSLNFAEGINVLCLINFKCDRNQISIGCAYDAMVDLPLMQGTITKLRNNKGSNYPAKLLTTTDTRPVSITKNHVRVDGKRILGPIFPIGYFKVNSVVEFNHMWKQNNGMELRASLDLTTKTLSQGPAGGDVAPVNAGGDVMPVYAKPKKNKVKATSGKLTHVQDNGKGLYLPSEATAIFDGKPISVVIPPESVSINSKNNVWVPKHFLKVGEEIKLHNLAFSEEKQVYQAEVILSFPKAYLENGLKSHRQ